jgi:hypothetical protein
VVECGTFSIDSNGNCISSYIIPGTTTDDIYDSFSSVTRVSNNFVILHYATDAFSRFSQLASQSAIDAENSIRQLYTALAQTSTRGLGHPDNDISAILASFDRPRRECRSRRCATAGSYTTQSSHILSYLTTITRRAEGFRDNCGKKTRST